MSIIINKLAHLSIIIDVPYCCCIFINRTSVFMTDSRKGVAKMVHGFGLKNPQTVGALRPADFWGQVSKTVGRGFEAFFPCHKKVLGFDQFG